MLNSYHLEKVERRQRLEAMPKGGFFRRLVAWEYGVEIVWVKMKYLNP